MKRPEFEEITNQLQQHVSQELYNALCLDINYIYNIMCTDIVLKWLTLTVRFKKKNKVQISFDVAACEGILNSFTYFKVKAFTVCENANVKIILLMYYFLQGSIHKKQSSSDPESLHKAGLQKLSFPL